KGQFAISSGYFQNGRRLVTCADFSSALTPTTSQSGDAVNMPCIAMPSELTCTLPRSELNRYLLLSAQKPPPEMRFAQGAKNGIPLRPGRRLFLKAARSCDGK